MRPIHTADSVFVPAPPERVLPALLAVERYTLWWPAALRVRAVSPPPHGLGSLVEIRALGSRFRCRIAAVEPPSRLTLEYVAGLHRGHGSWTLEPQQEGTKATYAVDLVPNGLRAKVLSHVMDFAALHSRQMQRVFGGLARHLSKCNAST
jgi:uncharacterized protein YndB with AHSA1/START domain